jgi:hypothetical protein
MKSQTNKPFTVSDSKKQQNKNKKKQAVVEQQWQTLFL